jgi:uncharacterized protein DUF3224
MKLSRILVSSGAIVFMAVAFIDLPAQSSSDAHPKQENQMIAGHAKGSFEVMLKPAPLADPEAGEKLGRMSFQKQFTGDLAGTSRGEMLSATTDVKGSAGYVAIEKVAGTLAGKKGSFVLQHSGVMDQGKPQSTILVVPDSGTDELAGIAGSFRIDIKDGKHFYEFDYTLPR